MIRISHDHKAIFCHIPRCGGTSIEAVLSDWDRVDHTQLGRLYFEQWPHRFSGTGDYVYNIALDYFTFTVVRNPYDRYLSGVNHCKNTMAKLVGRPIGAYWFHEHVMATQKAILGRLVPDYIMRLEYIDEQFDVIREMFGLTKPLQKLNSASRGKLTPGQIDWVTEHFAEDFEAFGYKKR